MVTVPEEGVSMPAHRPSNVVFPLPDGPMIAAVDPLEISKLTDDKTVRSPLTDRYVFVSCSVLKIALMHL